MALIPTNARCSEPVVMEVFLNWLAPRDFADRTGKRVASRCCIKVED